MTFRCSNWKKSQTLFQFVKILIFDRAWAKNQLNRDSPKYNQPVQYVKIVQDEGIRRLNYKK